MTGLAEMLILKNFMKFPKLIAITGSAGVGKDTVYEALKQYLLSFGTTAFRLSIGDEIKKEMNEFLLKSIGISAWTRNRNEKDVIRPLLVEFGRAKRFKFGSDYWAKMLAPKLKLNGSQNIISVLTDFRYFDFEYEWIRSQDSLIIYLERDGVEPANSDETENNPKIKAHADLVIKCPHFNLPAAFEAFLAPKFKLVLDSYGKEKETK